MTNQHPNTYLTAANRNIRLMASSAKFKNKFKNITAEKISFSLEQLLQLQLQQQQQQSLILKSTCNCKVCLQMPSHHYLCQNIHNTGTPNTYLNILSLLQHLTMIQPQTAPLILGQLLIPMLFFKVPTRDKTPPIKKNTFAITHHLPQNFILFQTDPNNSHLRPPVLVKSTKRAAQLMRAHHRPHVNKLQLAKFWQKKQNKKNSSSKCIHPKKIIHNILFSEAIPSYSFSDARNIVSKPAAEFIVHKDNIFSSEELSFYKQRSSQPFCMFRYEDNSSKKTHQFEIFTMQTLQMYEKNKQLRLNNSHHYQQNLNLIYIESCFRTKPTTATPSSPNTPLQLFYYFEYNANKPTSFTQSPIWQLVQLQTKLRLNKVNRIDPSYLTPLDLQLTISSVLGLDDELSSQKIRKIIQYKTYKIVWTLKAVCDVEVLLIRIKWVVDENDQPVLLECLEYEIDRENNDKIKKQMLSNHRILCGKNQHYQQEKQDDNTNKQQSTDLNSNIYKQFLSERRSTTNPSSELSPTNPSQFSPRRNPNSNKQTLPLHFHTPKKTDPKTKQTKSLSLVPMPKKQLSPLRIIQSLPDQSSIGSKRTTIERGYSDSKMMAGQKWKLTKEEIVMKYRCKLRKSYKLRPFKTEGSTQN